MLAPIPGNFGVFGSPVGTRLRHAGESKSVTQVD